MASRAKVTADWVSEGGVLLMGYEMYRLLTLKKSFATGRPKKTKKRSHPVIIDLDEEDRQQEFRRGGWLILETLLCYVRGKSGQKYRLGVKWIVTIIQEAAGTTSSAFQKVLCFLQATPGLRGPSPVCVSLFDLQDSWESSHCHYHFIEML